MNKKEKGLIVLGIVLIAFNLRAPITAVGSVVNMIQEQYSLSASAAGFITTLPLIAFAIVSPFVAKCSQRFGYGKSMAMGLILIMLGEVIRSYTNSTGLFVGTLLLGVGIAIGNVLIPSIIKTKFPNKLGLMTSVYVSSMCMFAAVGAGVSIPIAKGLSLGWENALASWLILAAVTLIVWIPQLKNRPVEAQETSNVAATVYNTSIWKSTVGWWVTLFMGVQSLIFYSLVAWLPTIVMSKGMDDSFAGNMALIFQLTSIPSTLVVPILCDKFKTQKGIVMFTCLLYLIGMILFLFAQSEMIILLSIILMALAMGGTISLSIAFISLRSPNARRTSELSGMSQSAGYLLAAAGPILMGLIYDNLQTWTVPIIIFCCMIVFLAFCGKFAGDNVFTDKESEPLVNR